MERKGEEEDLNRRREEELDGEFGRYGQHRREDDWHEGGGGAEESDGEFLGESDSYSDEEADYEKGEDGEEEGEEELDWREQGEQSFA